MPEAFAEGVQHMWDASQADPLCPLHAAAPRACPAMGENEDEKQAQAGQVFENFVQASTCKGTLQAFNILTRHLDLDPLDHRNFYSKLKSKVTTWKAKALWYKLDKRGSHKEYKRGKACMNTKCLIVGGGPCGLRTAIELAYLGAKVVVVEKRDTFSRNNVLHLWPYTIHDLRGLGAKKFYGKFCAGSIDHISIRQLQLILFKVALMLGVEIHVNVEFVKVLEPPEDQENQKIGWRAEFLPTDHALSEFEFDVIIGADGRRNTLEGFRRKEFRGKLAIAITANFINRNSTAEAKVEEISGVAFIFNQKFFQDLKEETGIDLENIVYYKDCTHYFVMTAKKQSLLDKGVIINDYIDTEMLLCAENVNQDNLLSYAREAADFATNYQLPSLDFAMNHYGQPDVAMFDFTSMYASENAALVRERQGHPLLVALVGDSLLEPFWPMGTGCARGFLAAFDTAWMVKSWDQGTPPLEVLAERESLYRLLPQTTPENINKNFEQYTLDPGTRYPNLNSNCVRPHQVKHLYITKELDHYPLERLSSVRRSVNLSRRESDIRPNKLLTWCQQQTEGYQHVSVTDLTTSWRSGLALCAIIHRFRPELINFDSLNEDDAVKNNQLAFDVAEREFGIPPVTTGKEMASAQEPDKLSMVMYLSKFYELFRGTPLRPVDSWRKSYGENADFSFAKSSISNNYLNLTLPRKRTPRGDAQTEENDMNKRRRKGIINLDEDCVRRPSSFSSRSLGSTQECGNSKEAGNQNKVKSMANQLLAKFEESTRNPSVLRQESITRKTFPLNVGGSDTCYFCKKRVYVMERLSAEGHFFHRECFRCSICATTLRLATYAFDCEEGKFYCKPHFIHCKTNSKQRKRWTELKQEREEEGTWQEQEAPRRDAASDSSCAVAAISTPEGSPPADEPTSPKKPKSVAEPQPSDMDSEATSPLPSEWTSVRFNPGEDTTGQDVLAVCVLVDCEDSSSDTESDHGDSEVPSTKPYEGRPWQPESLPLPKPLFRHSSLREPLTRAASPRDPEEPHTGQALHRANSFQAPSNHQNWRKFPSNLTPANKRSLSPSKESSPLPLSSWPLLSSSPPSSSSSASVPGHPLDRSSLPQVTAYDPHSPVSRDHCSPTPIFLRRAKSQGAPKEMPLYLPHGEVLERAEYCLVSPGGQSLKSPVEVASGGCQEAGAPPGGTRSTHGDPHLTVGKDRSLPDQEQSLTAEEDPGEGSIRAARGQEGESELAERTPRLKKLALTEEQKTMLLDWSDSCPESAPLQPGERLSQERTRNGRAGPALRPLQPLSLPQGSKEPPAAKIEAPEGNQTPTVHASEEQSVPPPRSPLRLITNAIRRSLEQFLHSSDGGKKVWAKPESKTLPTGQPHTFTSSFSLQRHGSNKDSNQQSPRKHSASRASTFFSLGSPASRAAQSSELCPPDSAHGLPNQQPTLFSALTSPPCSKARDVPTLLQKVGVQETLLDVARGPKKKASLFSSLRPKDKSFESFLQESKQRKDIRDLFSSSKGKMSGNGVPVPEKLMQPFRSASLAWMTRPPPPAGLAGSKHDRVGVQVTEATSSLSSTTSSSADEEFDPQLSLGSQEKKTLKKRRKLEKATKQLVKQEELKRLHKAQAIWRQLEEVEERQRASEIQGVRLEKALRGEAADSGTQDEAQLLQEWFKLVLEKNKLMRYESELLIMAQQLELEDHQSRLEQKLREKMLKEESQKDENDLNEEQEIFIEMMQVVKQRDKLVDSLEEQRIKEKAEDQHFESFVFSRGCQLSRT
ncbi:PREDICTED: protein-methionine sulfoxide oxidase MICAL2 isoform X4 [Chinchilla lanigera]|uniref:protein-methionine sulfoxide oxidase MICAL2 isoform X4 n=1 Tax=Chinchilla lanigera TaxID=34839 RepID=UPI00038E99BB|nr:PREDICTED: protein-methionine sulfoxide oxidase MICAL2 isoform X4 [Chinchilla lanigera]